MPRIDCICSVVDAARLHDEFACGDQLTKADIAEDDIENLIIQQIEFCNIILLNKASEVTPEQLLRIRRILRAIQPHAEIIDCDYCNVDLNKLLYTHMFNFGRVANSAAWIEALDGTTNYELQTTSEEDEDHDHHDDDDDHDHHDDDHDDDHDHHEHGHNHHHHHDHEGGEVEEYNIGTYVYYRRPAFDLNKFDRFVAKKWPKNIIRAKGVCYFKQNPDMSYLFEQAGRQKQLSEAGMWYATAPEEELMQFFKEEPGLLRDWDEKYGDRMQKIVFIGQNLDKAQIAAELDSCLE